MFHIYFQMWVIRINMRKGIFYKSQRTFACIAMSVRKKLTCRERWKNKMSQQCSIIKSPLSSDSLRWVTSSWGRIPWEHGHHELSDPLASKCLLRAEAQRMYADLPRQSVKSEANVGQGHASIVGTTKGRGREKEKTKDNREEEKEPNMRLWLYLHSGWIISFHSKEGEGHLGQGNINHLQ